MSARPRPHVALCLAVSLDGRIAAAPGRAPDFTSRDDLQRLFRLRAEADLLLIGAGTVRAEQVLPLVRNTALADAREARGLPRHPAACVVSGRLDLPWDGRYFRTCKQQMLVMTGQADAAAEARCRDLKIDLLTTGPTLDPAEGLAQLYARGFRAVLAEGGGGLVHALLSRDLVDSAHLTLAPVVFGGQAPHLASGPGLLPPARFRLTEVTRVGDELHTTYTRDRGVQSQP